MSTIARGISVVILAAALLQEGCGGDSLRLSLPDGNEVRYLAKKPSGNRFNVICDAQNASVWASSEERNLMRLRCVVNLQDADGNAVASAASIRLVAEVTEQGHLPEDGSQVHFVTDKGSFAPFGPDNTEAVTEIDVGTSGGQATASLYTFPGSSGTANVSASYVTIGSKTVRDSTRVQLSTGLQAMVEKGCPIQRIADDNNDFVFLLNPSCDPMDVEPVNQEPNHMVQGVIHNPRDGLLTLVFSVDGEEGFTDTNGNKTYDPGEFFYDTAEPYVDADDSGTYDSGEQFLDLDGDGQWSVANGRWDDQAFIWKTTHIMFSGPPHISAKTTHFEPSGINIDAGGSQMLTLYLMDINMNPIAGGGGGVLKFTIAGGAEIDGENEAALTDTMGATFTEEERKINVSSLTTGRDYTINIKDSDPSASEPVTLRTTVEWRPAPTTDDYSPTRQSVNLPDVTGTAN